MLRRISSLGGLLAVALTGCGGVAPHTLDGAWESSGGGGVACFVTEADAEAAELALNNGGGLTDALRRRIETLVPLEQWETAAVASYSVAGRSTEKILADVAKFLAEFAPIFRERQRLVEAHIDFTRWTNDTRLPPIEDAKPVRAIAKTNAKCRLIPLAVRYSRSRPGRLPEARVRFDQWLFEHKLDAIGRAILIVHEQLYLIAREQKIFTSLRVRPVVALLLCDQVLLHRGTPAHHSSAAFDFQATLADVYGDYYKFFIDDPADLPSVVPPGYTQYSRYRSFGRLLKKLWERKGKCLDDKRYLEQPPEKWKDLDRECAAKALRPWEVEPSLDDEEAFLFLARWWLDHYTDVLQTSENLVVWDRRDPAAMTELQRREMQSACRFFIKTHDEKQKPVFQKLLAKAVCYCSNLSIAVSKP